MVDRIRIEIDRNEKKKISNIENHLLDHRPKIASKKMIVYLRRFLFDVDSGAAGK